MLKDLQLPFRVYIPKGEELASPKNLRTLQPQQIVKKIAEHKASFVWDELTSGENPQTLKNSIVLTADTLVFIHGKILGKPRNRADAKKMLRKLSGKTHTVATAVCISSQERSECFVIKTKVTFMPLPNKLIEWYLNTGEPFDKAGSYGVQGLGASFIKKIQGSYSNVVGLPLSETVTRLAAWGITPWA